MARPSVPLQYMQSCSSLLQFAIMLRASQPSAMPSRLPRICQRNPAPTTRDYPMLLRQVLPYEPA
eukprot:4576796-Amphidinium_carterae.1